MYRFLQIGLFSNSDHTGKYNEVKSRHEFQEEVTWATKRMKRHKVHGINGITSDIKKLW